MNIEECIVFLHQESDLAHNDGMQITSAKFLYCAQLLKSLRETPFKKIDELKK